MEYIRVLLYNILFFSLFMKINIFILIIMIITSFLAVEVFANYFHEEISKDPIYLLVDDWAGYIPLYVAYENGFFEDEGVLVKFDILQDTAEIGEVIELENSSYDGYPAVYPQVLGSGNIDFNSSVVYVFDYSYGGDVIIGNPSIRSIKDLRGKKVGVCFLNGFSRMFLISLLEKNGLREEDVEFVEVPAYDVLDALKEGRIDAGHTWDPIKSEAIKAGYNLIASSKETPGLIIDVLAMKKSVIREREKDVQKIVNALRRAYRFIKENRKESYSLMANRTGVSFDDLVNVCKGIKLVSPEENILALTDSGDTISLYSTSKDISDFMVKHNQLDKGFSTEDLVDSRFVKRDSFFVKLLNVFKV